MRASPILTALFPAVRQEILTATLLSPERSWYLSELAAHLKTSPSSLQRELEALAASGILQRRQEGRRTYYRAETASPVFAELRDLFSKTAVNGRLVGTRTPDLHRVSSAMREAQPSKTQPQTAPKDKP